MNWVIVEVKSRRARVDRCLLGHIHRIHDQSRQHYGIVKCWKRLNAEGISCGRDRVARLRRAHGIYTRRRKRFVVTTRSKHRHWISPNRLKRDFTTTSPNRVWVGDVTFIATRSGRLYLSVLLDLYSRKVVLVPVQLMKDALEMAVQHRQPSRSLIHHTDRGSTYAMQSYRDTLAHALQHESNA